MRNVIRALTLAICCSTINHAQAAVMLAGGLSHEYNLAPGSRVSGYIELRNTGNQAEEVKIYQEDVRINRQGKTEFVPGRGAHPRSNANWINIDTDRVIIAPKTTQRVAYSLSVPQHNNMQGSYWSSLMLEPVSKKSIDSQLNNQNPDYPQLSISQKMRYAVRILSDIGNQGSANLVFDPPRIEKNASGERWFNVDIRNQGNRFTRPNVWLDVFDQQGRNVGKFKAEPHAMYAGEKENFRINIARLRAGSYKGLLAAEDNRSGQVFGSDINLNIKP